MESAGVSLGALLFAGENPVSSHPPLAHSFSSAPALRSYGGQARAR